MLWSSRTHIAERIGTGCSKGKVNLGEQRTGKRMIGTPNANRFKSGCNKIRNDRFFLQQKCEWTGPEFLRETFGHLGYARSIKPRFFEVWNVNDQRIELWSVFHFKDPRYGCQI